MGTKNRKVIQTFAISAEKKVTISPDELIYEEGKTGEGSKTVKAVDIKDIRCGIARKSMIFFEFQIYIRTKVDEIIKISFSSFVWKHADAFKNFTEISRAVWENFSQKTVMESIGRIRGGEEVEICDVRISLERVLIKSNGLLKTKEKSVIWKDLGIKLYKSGFDIYSLEKPHEINRKFSYLNDWNAVVLLSLLKTMEKAKK